MATNKRTKEQAMTLQNTTQKIKEWASRTTLKTRGELRVSSSCSHY